MSIFLLIVYPKMGLMNGFDPHGEFETIAITDKFTPIHIEKGTEEVAMVFTPISLFFHLGKKLGDLVAADKVTEIFERVGLGSEANNELMEYYRLKKKILNSAKELVEITYPNRAVKIRTIKILREIHSCRLGEALEAYNDAWKLKDDSLKISQSDIF
jgi:hypothetical protein